MIGGLPSGRWAPSDAGIIAARLVQLLPSRDKLNAPSVAANRGIRQLIRCLAVMWLIYAVVWLGALLMLANREPTSGMNHADTPLTNTVSPQVPLSRAG